MNRLILSVLLIVGIVVLIAPNLGHESEPAAASSEAAGAFAVEEAPKPPSGNGGDTVVERDGGGQFHLDADVDGQEVRFLVDTGADVVALTVEEAGRLGIAPDPASFAPILRTASGTGYGAPVRIGRLSVGGRDLEDVDAVVVRGLQVNLLGQSVLRRLGSVTLEGDRLVITG